MHEIRGSTGTYRVGDRLVGESDQYRLYFCYQTEATDRQCILQVANSAENNGDLDRAAYILQELKRRSDEVEAEYASVKKDSNLMLNYDLGFPELVDSFILHDQGNRRVNILTFRNIDDISKIVPLKNITEKDFLRVDLRTSGWIMGKLLKLLAFVHSEGLAVDLVSGANVLIEPQKHYVLIFDWSKTRTFDVVPLDVSRLEISQAARAIITVLGGDLETETFPDDGEDVFDRYTGHLINLARGGESNAHKAHERFYELIDSFWKREYYPFTTKPLV